MYPLLLFCIGVGFATGAARAPLPWSIVLAWPAVAFVLVAGAYVVRAPRLLGKRLDGTVHPAARAFFAPFTAFAWLSWHGYRLATREDVCNEVAPKLWLGRRPYAHDLPPGVEVVVDVTAELPAEHAVRTGKTYLCLPALDASVPSPADFCAMLDRLEHEERGMFVHCAFGHGRSAMLVAALLVRRGLASDVADAERQMRARRPRVGLKGVQRAYVERYGKR